MSLQFSVAVRNARLNAIESTVGVNPTMKFFSGAEPANCAAADPTGLLATFSLTNPWLNAASAGSETEDGTWTASASASGTAASFRIYDSGGTCHLQGSISMSGGGGDMILDNTNIASGQNLSVSTFTLTDANS